MSFHFNNAQIGFFIVVLQEQRYEKNENNTKINWNQASCEQAEVCGKELHHIQVSYES